MTRYTLITLDPNGERIATTNHTFGGALRLAFDVLLPAGYGPWFEFKCERTVPGPNDWLCPCAQPSAEGGVF